jgi:hypothetical protein
MYRWYWFRKLQLGETHLEEPRSAPAGAAAEPGRAAAPRRAAAGDARVGGERADVAHAA